MFSMQPKLGYVNGGLRVYTSNIVKLMIKSIIISFRFR